MLRGSGSYIGNQGEGLQWPLWSIWDVSWCLQHSRDFDPASSQQGGLQGQPLVAFIVPRIPASIINLNSGEGGMNSPKNMEIELLPGKSKTSKVDFGHVHLAQWFCSMFFGSSSYIFSFTVMLQNIGFLHGDVITGSTLWHVFHCFHYLPNQTPPCESVVPLFYLGLIAPVIISGVRCSINA